ncbi:hypothetical protein QQ045_028291 [Rhodiola kirilowii]
MFQMATPVANSWISRSDVDSLVDSVEDDDVYHVNKNEDTGNPIVSKNLTCRDNFVSWKKSLEIALSTRLKLGFIQGKHPKPNDRKTHAKWQRCNDVIMTWLISSISKDTVGKILHAKDVMTAWNMLRTRFAGTILARKPGLLKEVNNLVQGDMDVATYHGKLTKYWQELESIRKASTCPSSGNCVCCAEAGHERTEDRVVQSLIELNECYSPLRSNVFSKFKVPDMDIVFTMAIREECQRNATKTRYVEASYSQNTNNNYQNSQSNIQSFQNNNAYQSNQNGDNQARQVNAGRRGFTKAMPRLFCTNCQMTGHLEENCYKLVGYPPGHKLNKGNANYKQGVGRKLTAHSVNSVEDTENMESKPSNPFTDQINQIMAMIKVGAIEQT